MPIENIIFKLIYKKKKRLKIYFLELAVVFPELLGLG